MSELGRNDESVREGRDRSTDRIEDLLRTTGRRPAVPADRAERVKTVVRAHFEAESARRSRRRRVWVAATLAAAAALVTAVGLGVRPRVGPAPTRDTAALVEMVVESAWSQPIANGSPSPLRTGQRIEVGSELATEERGRLALRLTTGHSLRIDARTRVRVLSDRLIALDQGAVYVDSLGPAGRAFGSIEIQTPFGNVRDLGTQFEVRCLPESLRVRVREGKIALTRRDGSTDVDAGHELEIGKDGAASRRDLTAFGSEWQWVGDVTPMLRLEGRSLKEFLDWIARERGLRLRFAGSGVASSAPEIILSGSIDGMTLDQALESVLPTCQMAHRIDGDVLTVRSSRESKGSS